MKEISVLFINAYGFSSYKEYAVSAFKKSFPGLKFNVNECRISEKVRFINDADIIICSGKEFLFEEDSIKSLIKEDTEQWFAVYSFEPDFLARAKKMGVKHTIEKSIDNRMQEIVTFIAQYCDSENRSLGAGFNEVKKDPSIALVQNNAELTLHHRLLRRLGDLFK